MSAPMVGLAAKCPLCGDNLHTSRLGSRPAEPHAVLFRVRGSGEGILLCDDCAVLADLSPTLTLN
jgi:hypothetical protein